MKLGWDLSLVNVMTRREKFAKWKSSVFTTSATKSH